MKHAGTLFEVSWEVCQKVGGIHTVLSTKSRSLAERLGDAYVVVGPWLLGTADSDGAFRPEPGFEAFEEGCRSAGVPVRVGRWNVPGNPRTLLVEFTGLYAQKDTILGELWDRHKVDSLFGQWDYHEPVLFGRAAGMVIERWWRQGHQGAQGPAVAQFHEWMTGSGLLHVKDNVPEIGTVFTAHATVLGRALAATGVAPTSGLEGRTAEQAAESLNVRAKHSMEGACVRAADVFTTVSDVAAEEARQMHGREASPVLPNGWDPRVMAGRTAGVDRGRAAATLRTFASKFLGEDVGGAALAISSGRYEFHNKGFDVLLDAASDLQTRPGRPLVLFLLVPAGNSGVRREVTERLRAPVPAGDPLGVCTHALFDAEKDPIALRCRERGITNAKGTRVRVIHLAAYLGEGDGLIGLAYEAALQGADFSAFPSWYDAWGYTPQESLAVGVPSVTTDCTGFGRWMQDQGTTRTGGLRIIARRDRAEDKVRARLARALERLLEETRDGRPLAEACRATAALTEWAKLLPAYEEAHRSAREEARRRARRRHAGASAAPSAVPVRSGAQEPRPHIFPLDVASVLPRELEDLGAISRNWAWSWDPATVALFRDVSPETWERVRRNPVRLLREAPGDELAARAADPKFVERMRLAVQRMRTAVELPSASDADADAPSVRHPVAYVCAEFGIHESLPIYSGGLGALAGDHLKSASDLAFPLVAVGLLYRKGYMRQRLEGGADQAALEDSADPAQLALDPVVDAEGRPVELTLQAPGATVALRAWKAQVGRVPLYLLDADVESNRPEWRSITHALYAGDSDHRLRQEAILGFGGVRLLHTLGIEPSAWHVNEGHGAFSALERVRVLVKDRGLSFEEAREVVRATSIFTTHTPVPAGHDHFGEDLMRRYFSDAAEWLGVPWDRFFALGTTETDPRVFNMTRLAVEFSGVVNAVSRKHGEVSKALLRTFAPRLLTEEVPVRSVTNGVHLPTWTSPRVAALLGAKGPVRGADFARAAKLDVAKLAAARREARAELVRGAAEHVRRSFAERGDSPQLAERIVAGLVPDALFVGFARRFATYKRADLVLRDPARLRAILDGPGRPVRLLVAGKAHPRDAQARDLLGRIARVARSDEFVGRIVVLENYDMGLARTLVQGVDVWMNTPRRPLEASGTSGMKAAANGALNLSIGDGWWIEGFDGSNGWRIGEGEPLADDAAQDERDAQSLYALLENDVVPLFFDRDAAGVPRGWMERVRRSLATIPPVFDTDRMVIEYADLAYRRMAARFLEMREQDAAPARKLAARRARLDRGVRAVKILAAEVAGAAGAKPGDVLTVQADVDLGELRAGDVVVETLVGVRTAEGELRDVRVVALSPVQKDSGPGQRFTGSFEVVGAGAFGYGIRVRPHVVPGEGPSFHDPVIWA